MSDKREGIQECPHCGGMSGFFHKTRIVGCISQFNYDFGGDIGENGDLHEGLRYIDQKKAFCIDCEQEIKPLYGWRTQTND